MKSLKNELLILVVSLFCVKTNSFAQTTSTTANDFSSIVNYTGLYRYGVNLGYYGSNWPGEELATIATGSASLNVKGIGAKTFRIPLNDDHLTDFGMTAELGKMRYYTSLGAGDLTALVGSPHSTHKWDTTFAGSPEPAKVFKNLYQPVWLDASKTQINPSNYFAKYLYDVIQTYGSYIKFWEVINEPDFTHSNAGWLGDTNPIQSGSWFDHNPTPLELENLRTPIYYFIRELRVAWEVIKRLQPTSYVGIGGLGYRSFLDAVLRNTDNPVDGSVTPDYPNKGGAYFEILSFHDYPQYGLSNWDNAKGQMIYYRHSDAAVNAFLTIKNNMNDVLSRYGYNNSQYPSKQYICTETGVSRVMGGTDWGSNEGQRNYQIKGQVAAQKNGIKQLYWYQLGDGTTTNQFDQMGLYYYFGNTTPYNNLQLADQGKAMKTTSDLLYGKVYDAAQTAALNLPSTIDGAAFRASNGSYTYVLWARTTTDLSEYASATYNFPHALVTGGTLTRKEWDFSETNTALSINSYTINLTGTPSFFELTSANPPTYYTVPGKVEAENYTNMSGIQTESTTDAGGGKDVGYINPNDWMDYNFNVLSDGTYTIYLRVASTVNNAQFQLQKPDGTVLTTVTLPNTGGWQNWQTITSSITLPQGQQTIRITALTSGWNINYMDLSASVTPPPATSFKVEAEDYITMIGVQKESTTDSGGGQNISYIDPNDWMDYKINAASSGIYTVQFRVASQSTNARFDVRKSDGTTLTTVNVPNTGGWQNWQTITAKITLVQGQQTIRLYSTSSQWNSWNINWMYFTSSSDTNTTQTTFRVEAENWKAMSGVQTEITTDEGGGKNVSYIDPNDWMDYSINAPSTGTYTVNFRIASQSTNAKFDVLKNDGTVLAIVSVPNTGGWQNWQTITASITLPQGQQTIRLLSISSQWNNWNINWMDFSTATLSSTTAPSIDISPNPVTDKFILTVTNNYTGNMEVQIADTSGTVKKDLALTKSNTGSTQVYISIGDLAAGSYTVKVIMSPWSALAPVTKL